MFANSIFFRSLLSRAGYLPLGLLNEKYNLETLVNTQSSSSADDLKVRLDERLGVQQEIMKSEQKQSTRLVSVLQVNECKLD
jgi:hypothetical protein